MFSMDRKGRGQTTPAPRYASRITFLNQMHIGHQKLTNNPTKNIQQSLCIHTCKNSLTPTCVGGATPPLYKFASISPLSSFLSTRWPHKLVYSNCQALTRDRDTPTSCHVLSACPMDGAPVVWVGVGEFLRMHWVRFGVVTVVCVFVGLFVGFWWTSSGRCAFDWERWSLSSNVQPLKIMGGSKLLTLHISLIHLVVVKSALENAFVGDYLAFVP